MSEKRRGLSEKSKIRIGKNLQDCMVDMQRPFEGDVDSIEAVNEYLVSLLGRIKNHNEITTTYLTHVGQSQEKTREILSRIPDLDPNDDLTYTMPLGIGYPKLFEIIEDEGLEPIQNIDQFIGTTTVFMGNRVGFIDNIVYLIDEQNQLALKGQFWKMKMKEKSSISNTFQDQIIAK